MLAELGAVCDALNALGVAEASVSFGWDSNLPIDQMWKGQRVAVQDIANFIATSGSNGISWIGRSDVFVEVPGL